MGVLCDIPKSKTSNPNQHQSEDDDIFKARRISDSHANEETNRGSPRKAPLILKEVVKVSPYVESKWTTSNKSDAVEDAWPVRLGKLV